MTRKLSPGHAGLIVRAAVALIDADNEITEPEGGTQIGVRCALYADLRAAVLEPPHQTRREYAIPRESDMTPDELAYLRSEPDADELCGPRRAVFEAAHPMWLGDGRFKPARRTKRQD